MKLLLNVLFSLGLITVHECIRLRPVLVYCFQRILAVDCTRKPQRKHSSLNFLWVGEVSQVPARAGTAQVFSHARRGASITKAAFLSSLLRRAEPSRAQSHLRKQPASYSTRLISDTSNRFIIF